MAETGSNQRTLMSAEELQIIQETEDPRDAVHRGAMISDATDLPESAFDLRPLTFQKGGPNVAKVPTLRPQELSLMHCNLICENSDWTPMWTDIVSEVVNIPNTDPMKDGSFAMIGNVYDHGNFCEYRLALFNVEGKPVVDFKRMSGDGFVMDLFFRNVKNALPEQYYQEAEVEESDEYFDDYSDSEDEDEELTSYGFLQLSYDKDLVCSWVQKIKNRHIEDQNHIMGLMAYNALQAENLKIIISKGGADLRKLISQKLEQCNNAALVRNASALLAEITGKGSGNGYGNECVLSVFDAMTHWVPGNSRRSANRVMYDITESRETVNNLVRVLHNLISVGVVTRSDMMKQLCQVREESRDLLEKFIHKQQESESTRFLTDLLNEAKQA